MHLVGWEAHSSVRGCGSGSLLCFARYEESPAAVLPVVVLEAKSSFAAQTDWSMIRAPAKEVAEEVQIAAACSSSAAQRGSLKRRGLVLEQPARTMQYAVAVPVVRVSLVSAEVQRAGEVRRKSFAAQRGSSLTWGGEKFLVAATRRAVVKLEEAPVVAVHYKSPAVRMDSSTTWEENQVLVAETRRVVVKLEEAAPEEVPEEAHRGSPVAQTGSKKPLVVETRHVVVKSEKEAPEEVLEGAHHRSPAAQTGSKASLVAETRYVVVKLEGAPEEALQEAHHGSPAAQTGSKKSLVAET